MSHTRSFTKVLFSIGFELSKDVSGIQPNAASGIRMNLVLAQYAILTP